MKSYATTDRGYVRYSGLNSRSWYPKSPQRNSRDRINARYERYDYRYTTGQLRERIQGQIELRNKATKVAVAYNNHYCASAVI